MAAWKAEREELLDRVRQLEGMVADLEKFLGRNSSNSSKPPSSDPGGAKSDRAQNANRAARRAIGRRQGKQPGSPGFTLSQVPDPDEVVTHRPVRCRACDRTLSDLGVVGTTVRQVFDVPDPTVIVTEHRAEQRRFIPRSCTRSPRANGSVASSRYGRAGSRPRRVLSCKRNPG